jgi:hypothetical protein
LSGFRRDKVRSKTSADLPRVDMAEGTLTVLCDEKVQKALVAYTTQRLSPLMQRVEFSRVQERIDLQNDSSHLNRKERISFNYEK